MSRSIHKVVHYSPTYFHTYFPVRPRFGLPSPLFLVPGTRVSEDGDGTIPESWRRRVLSLVHPDCKYLVLDISPGKRDLLKYFVDVPSSLLVRSGETRAKEAGKLPLLGSRVGDPADTPIYSDIEFWHSTTTTTILLRVQNISFFDLSNTLNGPQGLSLSSLRSGFRSERTESSVTKKRSHDLGEVGPHPPPYVLRKEANVESPQVNTRTHV